MSNRPKLQAAATSLEESPSGSNPLIKWLALGVILVVAVAVVVALLASSDAEQAQLVGVGNEVSDITVTGDALSRFDSTAPDGDVDAVAPAFAATTFEGETVRVVPGDGRSKVISFFAHWCPHCQRELPRLSRLINENGLPAGVDMIAVSTAVASDRDNYPPSAWFAREGWTEPVVRDSAATEIAQAYGLSSFPYTVFVGGDGSVIVRLSGELTVEQWESLFALAASRAG